MGERESKGYKETFPRFCEMMKILKTEEAKKKK